MQSLWMSWEIHTNPKTDWKNAKEGGEKPGRYQALSIASKITQERMERELSRILSREWTEGMALNPREMEEMRRYCLENTKPHIDYLMR